MHAPNALAVFMQVGNLTGAKWNESGTVTRSNVHELVTSPADLTRWVN